MGYSREGHKESDVTETTVCMQSIMVHGVTKESVVI